MGSTAAPTKRAVADAGTSAIQKGTSRIFATVCQYKFFTPPVGTIMIFFFLAEDGIRDRNVTGVQTCALPILKTLIAENGAVSQGHEYLGKVKGHWISRSEERRVGKDYRSPWPPYAEKKN